MLSMISTHVPLVRWSIPAAPGPAQVPTQSPVDKRIASLNDELDAVRARIATTHRLQNVGTQMVSYGPVALLGLVASLWYPAVGTICTAGAGIAIVTGGVFALIQVARRKRMEKQVEDLERDMSVLVMANRQVPQPGTIEVTDAETRIGTLRVPRNSSGSAKAPAV